MPKISVIIPACNEEAYLGNTLDSLRKQNYLDYETIVVCNGCTDKTEQVAQRFYNSKTKILSLPNANVSIARNAGADAASGKTLLFLDADTLLEKDALGKIDTQFKGAVATTKTRPSNPSLKFRLALDFKNLYNLTGIYKGCSGVLICRKGLFEKVGRYPELPVKEHRKLIIALKRFGKYQVIDTYSTTSMRRFERWGLLRATGFWIKEWFKNYVSDLKKSKYERIR